VNSKSLPRYVVAEFVFLALTLLTTTAGASETVAPTVVSDALSAVLARSYLGLAEEARIFRSHGPAMLVFNHYSSFMLEGVNHLD